MKKRNAGEKKTKPHLNVLRPFSILKMQSICLALLCFGLPPASAPASCPGPSLFFFAVSSCCWLFLLIYFISLPPFSARRRMRSQNRTLLQKGGNEGLGLRSP